MSGGRADSGAERVRSVRRQGEVVPWAAQLIALLWMTMAGGRSAADGRADGPAVFDLDARAVAGGRAQAQERVRLSLLARDPATGQPLTGLTPGLWLVPDGGGGLSCELWAARLLNAPAAQLGAEEIGGFDVVQATSDGRLVLVDPQLNLASANIKQVLDLGEVPAAWAMQPAGEWMAVGLRRAAALRILSLSPLAVADDLALPAAPTALWAGDTGFLVATEKGQVLSWTEAEGLARPVTVGEGPVLLGAAGGGQLFAVAENGQGRVGRMGELARPFDVKSKIMRAAYAPLADALYLLEHGGRRLWRVPLDSLTSPVAVPLPTAMADMAADVEGRQLAFLSENRTAVALLDTESNRVRHSLRLDNPVSEMVYTAGFLYLMQPRLGGVTRVLMDPEGGAPAVSAIAAGSSAMNRTEYNAKVGKLSLMATVPQAGLLLGSVRDRAAYMVSEDGMQAAMSVLPLKGGTPAGILLRYRGLSADSQLGSYHATWVPPAGGDYLAVLRTDEPAMVHCERVTVSGKQRPREETRDHGAGVALRLQEPVVYGAQEVRFALSHKPTEAAGSLRVERVLLMSDDGKFHAEASAIRPNGEQQVAELRVRQAGGMRLFVQVSDSAGHRFTLSQSLLVATESGI